MRFTTKPGALLQGSGSLSSLRVNQSAWRSASALRAGALHDFHQLHLRHGIEEMNADQAARFAQLLGEHLDLDARGVGGEYRARLELGLELGIQRALGIDVLEDGLDDDVGMRPRRRPPRPRCSRASGRGGRLRGPSGACRRSPWPGPAPAAINSALRSCSVTVMPRNAAQAAMSPPMTPAPTTCRCSKFRRRLSAQALQPVLQQEHAHQVARGGRAHELAIERASAS